MPTETTIPAQSGGENPADIATDQNAKVYELGYLLLPTVSTENLGSEIEKIKKALSALKATPIFDEPPKLIDLAYEMERVISNKKQKFTKGYFGWIKFELESDSILKLKEALDHNDIILRFLIIKTVREHTLASKKPIVKRRKVIVKKEKEDKPKKEISKEEIDKKIEELVLEE